MKNKRKGFQLEPEMLIWICLLTGVICLALQLLLSISAVPPLYSGLTLLAVFIAASAAILIKCRLTLHQYTEMRNEVTLNGAAMTDLIEQSDIPAVITHDDGTVIWYNAAMRELLVPDGSSLFGKNLGKFFPFDVEALRAATRSPSDADRIGKARALAEKGEGEGEDKSKKEASVSATTADTAESRTANGSGGVEYRIGDRRFLAKAYSVKVPAENVKDGLRNYNLTLFDECTELFDLKDRMIKDNLIVAYIVLDNLEELAQYVRINYRQAANNIEMHIKQWGADLGGILCEYDRDKYMMLFSQEKLEETIAQNFPILDMIRAEELGDSSMSVTVSMGISGVGATIADREHNAQLALDTALRRGGDQVVIRRAESFEIFGGRSKSTQKREMIDARVNAKFLAELIRSHNRIMVMGHKNPDCDSIGACLGMARFARTVGAPYTNVRIIVDTESDTFLACTNEIVQLPEYKNMFLNGASALDQITSDTLLIVVDANNFNIIESPDVAKSVADLVVVDHHRKVSEFSRPLLLEYIIPSASSASELIAEMIESELPEGSLLKEEANVMLSGIMLDTMNFTRSTGMRTFAAAYFLRGAGATSEKARLFFEDDITEHLAEAKFFMPENVTIYRDNMAIAVSLGTDEKYDRVAASKAAERLITVRQVSAAFTLVKIGETIHISARSTGTINVQLILEKLRGGGHFDAAGAQVTGRTMNEVLVLLKSAINHYLDD